jgi:hypothetical protein
MPDRERYLEVCVPHEPFGGGPNWSASEWRRSRSRAQPKANGTKRAKMMKTPAIRVIPFSRKPSLCYLQSYVT